MRGWINSKAKAFARAALWLAVCVWPAESCERGRAIEAEFDSVESARGALLWALGGVIVFTKAIWKGFWHSLKRPFGVASGSGAEELLACASHVPRMPRWVTAMLLAGALSLLLLPEARQGASEVIDSWRLFHSEAGKRGGLVKLVERAERERDAHTLAFVAMELGPEIDCKGGICVPRNLAESVRLADEATALDPSLTWVYMGLLEGSVNGPIPEQWVHRLEHWDPENAVPHLLEAERIAREFRAQWELDHSGSNFPYGQDGDRLYLSDAAWLAAMDRAINAPIFDSYFVRHSELNREVMRRQHIEKPSTAFFALVRHRTAHLHNASVHVDLLMARGTEAEKAGDLKLAAECYWRAARFGERLRVQGMDIEAYFGTPIQKLAYEKLEAVLKKQGEFREAELVAYNLAEAKRASRPRMPAWTSTRQVLSDTMRWSAMLVQISAVSMLLVGSAAILAFIPLLLPANRWLPRRLRTFAGYTAEFAPLLLLLCCGVFSLSYHPFAKTFHTYLNAKQEITDLRPFMDSFATPPSYGGGIIFSLFGQRIFTVYFWWGVITIGALVIAWILIRMLRPHTAHSEA